jgi:phospholipid/cholesterol/gamma-HCH transport system substrate-binding protein
MGWCDDFSTTGMGFDALGAIARAHTNFSETLPPTLGPLRQAQFRRCPGGGEALAPDGSNDLPDDLVAALDCEESDRAVGDVP